MEQWCFQSFQDNLCTCFLVTFQSVNRFSNCFGRMNVCRSTTGNDTFLYCCSCGVQGIFHTKFCFFHLCLRCCSDTDNSYAACKFCKSFLKFFSVKVRCCLFDLCLDLGNAVCDCILISHTINNYCIFFLYLYRFCTSKLIHGCIFQFHTEFLRNNLTTCQCSNVF